MNLIGDNITRRQLHQVSDPSQADLETIRNAFVPTTEAREFFSRVAAQLAPSPRRQPRAILLTGERGTGKTFLLRYLESFLAHPQTPPWKEMRVPVPDPAKPDRGHRIRYIQVPENTGIDLAGYLIENASGEGSTQFPAAEAGPTAESEVAAALKKCAADLSSHPIAVLAVDGISRRMSRLVDEVRIRRETDVCRLLAEELSRCGILTVLAADEDHLRHTPERSASAAFAGLKAICDSCRISRRQIEEIVFGVLAAKDRFQHAEIQKTLEYLNERLPRFLSIPESFAELYPIHPQVFSILFPLRAVLPRFSPLGFAAAAIEAACNRSGVHLITHETLFDFILPELRSSRECTSFLRSYDELCTEAISHLSPSLQAKARALAKGITLDTLCDAKPASVRTLANALLMYDDTQPLPGCSLTAAILLEMEERGRSFLAGGGEGLDRTYRLLAQQMRAVSSAVPGHELPQDDLRTRIPQLIYDWFRVEIPAWKPNPSPKYWRTSLSMTAPIPDGGKQNTGIVHFKNILDPFWSRDDLVSLQGSPYPWILLILSPFEHFYEFEEEIAAIAASSAKISVWHPDLPTPAEAEQLRRLAIEYSWPSHAGGVEGDTAADRIRAARPIFAALYITRGKLITNHGPISPGEEIKDQTLAQYLASHLRALSAGAADAAAEDTAAYESPGVEEEEFMALNWAAQLSGEEDLRETDLQSAETRLVSWWLSRQEMEANTLVSKLNPLPDILMTTRFWGEYRRFVRHLEMLRPTFQLLHVKSISLREAMSQVRQNFNADEDALRRWKRLNLELAGLARWLPALEHMREYLSGAFFTTMEKTDGLRSDLLQRLEQPHQFLDAASRDSFDRNFLEFKTQYIDCYNARHQDAMQIAAGERGSGLRINAGALRNLELLSRLHHADKSIANRVHIIARWIQGNQCALPVRKILERSPRCYCNFNPASDSLLDMAADRINGLVEQGIDYFRTVLRNCREQVIEELKRMRVDQACAQQIAPLLGSGALLPLTPPAIEILNRVIEKHPQSFLAAYLSRGS